MITRSRLMLLCLLVAVGASQSVSAQGGAPATPGPAPAANAMVSTDSTGRVTLLREEFFYERRGRRDPFASLIASGEVRPLFADLRVTGILVDPATGNSVAMLKDASTNQLYRAKVGAVFGRIRVTAIRANEVALAIEEFGNTRQEVLMLKDPRKEKTP
ncbi:MAG: hypothetical protein RLZZ63_1458 [Gemmatimonadota bacterium]|jgi:hypothetical protein